MPKLSSHETTTEHYTTNSQDAYRKTLNRITKAYPCLSASEERELAIKMAQGDTRAKERLILSNLRLVLRITRQYSHRDGVSFSDLFQDGLLGLLKAVEKFDWSRGHRFSTYACWWIQQAVLQSFAEHDRLIRLPGHIVSNLSKLRRAQSQIEEENGRQATIDELAKALEISPKRVQGLMTLTHKPVSIHSPINSASEENTQTLEETIVMDEASIENQIEQSQLFKIIDQAIEAKLNDREKDILEKRFMYTNKESCTENKWTLESLGQIYGITRESVRQSEQRAILKIRSAVEF